MERKKSLFREYAETLICAFIIAMVIRTFVVQAFKIPTGSMETTLHGDQRHGDRIFVNKFIFAFTEPKRGDIVVFTTKNIPGLDKKKDYIKRLIALPGEKIEIRNHLIYINGEQVKENVILQNKYYNSQTSIALIETPKKKYNIPQTYFLVMDPEAGDYYVLSEIIYKLPPDIKQGDVFDISKIEDEELKQIISPNAVLVGRSGQNVEFKKDGLYVDKVLIYDKYKKNQFYAVQGQFGEEGRSIVIPDNTYFVLGDNSGNSKDSRYWGIVPKKNVKGKAIFIWWPPKRWGIVK